MEHGLVSGTVDRASLRGGYLWVRGWSAIPRDGIDGFRVCAGQKELAVVSWEAGLRHLAAHRFSGGRACGFELRAAMGRTPGNRPQDLLVAVVPVQEGRERAAMFGVLNPTFPIPPRREWILVGSSFLPEACIALGCLVNQAGLRRRESVLDIGCGLGRLAYLLSGYLLPSARYEGLEPVKRWVRRNRKLLTARFHNFHFCEFPVRHAIYNPRGKLDPATARFPCARASFDLAFATSVFQHNRGRVARNYLAEIARVLRPGGRALISCFLLDAQPGQTRAGRRGLEFSHPLGDCWTADPRRPETGIAFLERDFYQWAAEHGLAVHARWKGRWRSPGPGKLFQDLLVLTKANRARHLSGAAQRMRLP